MALKNLIRKPLANSFAKLCRHRNVKASEEKYCMSVRIQCFTRKYQAKSVLRERKILKIEEERYNEVLIDRRNEKRSLSAIIIQSNFRRFNAEKLKKTRSTALSQIQKAWRISVARRKREHAYEVFFHRHRSAIFIQTAFRRLLARNSFLTQNRLKEARKRQQRIVKRYQSKFESEGAAWIIQQAWHFHVEFHSERNKETTCLKMPGYRKNVKSVYNRDM